MDQPQGSCTSAVSNGSSDQAKPKKEKSEINVVLVDGHPAIRKVLSRRVNQEADMNVVGTYASATEALSVIEQQRPEIVVAEISLGGIDGLTLTRRIRSVAPETRILIFSMYDDSTYAERAIQAGASGYIVKTKPTQDVVEAIQAITDGQIYLDQDIRSDILENALRQEEGQESGIEALTLREMTVFQMLGDGNSVSEIADSLGLSRKTIERHRRRIKEKLDCNTVDEVLQYSVLWTSDRQMEVA